MVYIHKINYHAAIKRNEVVICARIQMNHKNIQNERSHTQKATSCVIPYIQSIQNSPNLQRGKTD